jgi:hypothetical protein
MVIPEVPVISEADDSIEWLVHPTDGVKRVLGVQLRRLESSSKNWGSSNSSGSITASMEEIGVRGAVGTGKLSMFDS